MNPDQPGSALVYGMARLAAKDAEARDRARAVAVRLEQQVAAVDAIHVNTSWCVKHSLVGHDCGSPVRFRCSVCMQRDHTRPCQTWQAIHPEQTP